MGWVPAVGSAVAKQISRKEQLISDNASFVAGASGEDEDVAAQPGKVGSKKWATVSKIAGMASGAKGGDKSGGAAVESVESADMAAQTIEPMAAWQASTQAANAAGQAVQAGGAVAQAGQIGGAAGANLAKAASSGATDAIRASDIVKGKLNVLGYVKKAAETAGKAVKGIGTNVYEYVKDENVVTGQDGKVDWGKTAQKQINKRAGRKPDKSGMMAYQQTTAEDEERRRRQLGGGKYNVK